MGEIKLKPCPFCKTEAYTRITALKNEELQGFISCNNPKCLAQMRFSFKAEKGLLNFEDVIIGIYEAIEKWNKRAGEDGKGNGCDRNETI